MFAAKNELLTRPSGYKISRSLRFRSSASAYLSRTPASAGNRSTWTWSGWVKRGKIGAEQLLFNSRGDATNQGYIGFNTGDTLEVRNWVSGNTTGNLITTQVFRDVGAWGHLVVVYNSPDATPNNRIRIYWNGAEITAFGTRNNPSSSFSGYFNNTNAHWVGAEGGTGAYLDGYLAEVNFIDGQALTPSSFGAFDTNGVWQPIACTVSDYGKNGFYLPFSDSANIFNDKAAIATNHSAANNWTASANINTTSSGVTYDWMLDSPTNYADGGNGRGNYAVLNPLNSDTNVTLSQANLQITTTSGSYQASTGTIGVSSGKWYWEVNVSTNGLGSIIGIANLAFGKSSQYVGQTAGSYGYYGSNGNKYNSNTSVAYGASYGSGDVIGIALDLDNGAIYFGKQTGGTGSMVWQNSGVPTSGSSMTGAAYTGLSGTFVPAIANDNTQAITAYLNFGQRPFSATPPSGFSALNTQNLPTPTIANGAQYMAATIYGGTGSAGSFVNTVNNTSFKPDALWIKSRSQATGHYLQDSVRGAANILNPDQTSAEANGGSSYVTSFDNSGWSVGSGAGGINISGQTYVAWQWRAGNNSGTTNNDGFVPSTVSANTTAGFSIATYTGNGSNSSVGHGLGVAPSMIIVKSRSAATNWTVYHSSVGTGKYLNLNTSTAPTTDANFFTSVTSTLFSMTGSATSINTNAATYVAYCFAPVAGYSAFGSYTGNGSADGPFIYTGFRPRWLMLKRTDSSTNWLMLDTTRNTYNVMGDRLLADTTAAETNDGPRIDILSNGFKLRESALGFNVSSSTQIYAAFAETPFKFSRSR